MTDTLFDTDSPTSTTDPIDASDTKSVKAPGQWRLSQVQIANWGTFHGSIYRMPISREGHLITGPSGSGKSSLLDAIAAVLTPDKWLRFNQAAQGSQARSDQRSLVSYIRGAWSRMTDEHEDRVVSSYLRDKATWSGILLQYSDGTGRTVSLSRLFFMRGTSTAASDLTDLCLFERSPVDLQDLQPFAFKGIEARKVQQAWPNALVTSGKNHGRFYARLRNTFGIEQENALHLLHKTQAAKSLDSLDRLFRDYMLDPPRTFELADEAIEQFDELRDAHQHVVQLRLQRDLLLELAAASEKFDAADAKAQIATQLGLAVPHYQRHLALSLARAEHNRLSEDLFTLTATAKRTEGAVSDAFETQRIAQHRQSEVGGDLAAGVQQRLADAKNEERATEGRWETLRRQLKGAGINQAPTSAGEFAELIAEIGQVLSSRNDASGPTYEQHDRLSQTKATRMDFDTDIQALRQSGTTVPARLLAIRSELAAATGLPTSALPFAAELIEVRSEHAKWTGAIERVLRPFALSMLVRTESLPQVRRWVDANNIGARLVYEDVEPVVASPRAARSEVSLVNRIVTLPGVYGRHFTDWIDTRLAKRFDYACVDTVDELDEYERAVTVNGQIRSSRTRYEKDDRVRLNDRSKWVLGNREAKLEALVEQLQHAIAEEDHAQSTVEDATERARAAEQQRGTFLAIREQEWEAVDREAAENRARTLAQQLADLTRVNSDLAVAVEEVRAGEQKLKLARDEADQARHDLQSAQDHKDKLDGVISALTVEIETGKLPDLDPETTTLLEQRFRQVKRKIGRDEVAEVGQEVERALNRERALAQSAAQEAGLDIASYATRFKERWPAHAVDLSASIADRSGYLEILDNIVTRGLPDHEADFLKLLRERSRDLIGALLSEIHGAFAEVQEGIDPINAALAQSEFDTGRYLRIQPKLRRSETVGRFIADLRSVSEGSWTDDTLESAEKRFATLAEIMNGLSSSERIERKWRNQCLDTREHVTFLAHEVDANGRIHATYDSGAAMSGGQQQKLVVFCLAAALRYQLADVDEQVPGYGSVIFDEAFDKADSRYTRMALDVFVQFGFHLVLATPQKLLQTIEPYVGAATSIDNPDRKRSLVSHIVWEETRQPREPEHGAVTSSVVPAVEARP